jgi:hypothetical protein
MGILLCWKIVGNQILRAVFPSSNRIEGGVLAVSRQLDSAIQ